ncbi:hypothetical protein QFC21_007129 [Naganishia friedmannii]|uniref:Uncharacterized protein n=1 Tax=Naganishia friedmannii TaxID=89922 RepID=A0ACC2UXI8_9TREE|nr:hypothetical protein QFC21_007129 [Naganishia friedmannii]
MSKQTGTPPPSPAALVGPVDDAALEEYSPSRPGWVFVGDWEDFCDFDAHNEEEQPVDVGGANTVDIVHPPAYYNNYDSAPYGHEEGANLALPPGYDDDVIPSSCHPAAFSDPIWSPSLSPQEILSMDEFLSSQGFIDWYLGSVQSGALDHINYADTFAPPPYYAQCVDPSALHHDSYYQHVKPAVGFDSDDGAEGINICEPPAPARRPRAPAPPPLKLDCSDLNDVKVILATPTDDGDSAASVASTTCSVTETEDEVEYIEPEDVIRHYWIRGDIKYTFCCGGRRYYMTAEQMEDRFGGVKFALWHYWKVKRAGRIPYARIVEYLQKMGHQGFFREMVWHLCPKRIADMLYAARKADTLDDFVREAHSNGEPPRSRYISVPVVRYPGFQGCISRQ